MIGRTRNTESGRKYKTEKYQSVIELIYKTTKMQLFIHNFKEPMNLSRKILKRQMYSYIVSEETRDLRLLLYLF